jgi:hypothetical protein
MKLSATRRRGLAAAGIALALVISPLAAGADSDEASRERSELKPEVLMLPGFDERSRIAQTAWIAYAAWLLATADQSVQKPGLITPAFEQEVAARKMAVRMWVSDVEDEKGSLDPYLEQLRSVDQAGFMREYIWTYLRRVAWKTEPAGLQLAAFAEWARGGLRDHTPETLTAANLRAPSDRK